jgi:cytochrome c peroxidase
MSIHRVSFLLFLLYGCLCYAGLLSAREPIEPLPVQVDYDAGKALFFDPILSHNRSIACVSCHDLSSGGADSRDVSIGVNGMKGNIQSPTVLNARYNFKQFWNGRVTTLKEQASGPIHNPAELAMNAKEVESRINASKKYQALFSQSNQSEYITFSMILDALTEFEKSLVTPNSKFDRYLRGEEQLSQLEEEGYQAFKELGCITCHNGINIGGNSFQKMGTIIPYTYKDGYPDCYSLTQKEYHKNVFKVPTLRNIALSAPYFHDASAKNLRDAIKSMSYHNLGYIISEDQVNMLSAFLNTLTGEKPAILE